MGCTAMERLELDTRGWYGRGTAMEWVEWDPRSYGMHTWSDGVWGMVMGGANA